MTWEILNKSTGQVETLTAGSRAEAERIANERYGGDWMCLEPCDEVSIPEWARDDSD